MYSRLTSGLQTVLLCTNIKKKLHIKSPTKRQKRIERINERNKSERDTKYTVKMKMFMRS